MPLANRNIEKFFFLYLILTPILDIFGGAYIHVGSRIVGENLSSLITPTLIVRMMILLLFVFYILSLRDKKSILTILPIGVAWLATVAGEFLFAPTFSLFAEMQYMAKYVYNISVLLVYWRLFTRCSLNREQMLNWLNWYISLSLLILSLSIHIPYILGLGYSTYADRFGYFGARGFFYSGNDITAVLMMLIPIALINYARLAPLCPDCRMRFHDLLPQDKERRRHLFYLAAPATALTALFSIATKTAFIAFGVTMVVLGIYFWRTAKEGGDKTQWQAYIRVIVAFVALFAFLSLFGLLRDLAETLRRLRMIFLIQAPEDIMLSGRVEKLLLAFKAWLAGGPFTWVFGIGRGTQRYIIEMDVFEVLCYYGLAGALAMLWLYLKLGINILKRFIPRRREDYALAAFISVGLTAAYAVMAGHVLFSVTSGFYFVFMLLYSYLYYAQSMEDFNLM